MGRCRGSTKVDNFAVNKLPYFQIKVDDPELLYRTDRARFIRTAYGYDARSIEKQDSLHLGRVRNDGSLHPTPTSAQCTRRDFQRLSLITAPCGPESLRLC